jgi:hypothetical protein
MTLTHHIRADEADLLRTSVDAEGMVLARAACHHIKEGWVEAEAVWIMRRDQAPVCLTAEWFETDSGDRYGAISARLDDEPDESAVQVRGCEAWIHDVDILSVHHNQYGQHDVTVDAGVEFKSNTNEVFSVCVADPRDHDQKFLLIQGENHHHRLGGMAIARRCLTSEIQRSN